MRRLLKTGDRVLVRDLRPRGVPTDHDLVVTSVAVVVQDQFTPDSNIKVEGECEYPQTYGRETIVTWLRPWEYKVRR